MPALKRAGFTKVEKLINTEDVGNTFLRDTSELLSGYIGVTCQKAVIFRSAAVRTSDPSYIQTRRVDVVIIQTCLHI
jgi:hypothetical protein